MLSFFLCMASFWLSFSYTVGDVTVQYMLCTASINGLLEVINTQSESVFGLGFIDSEQITLLV